MLSRSNSKLSRLQKAILKSALQNQENAEQDALKINALAKGLKPDVKPCEPAELPHVSRNGILRSFFGLKMRKWRFKGSIPDSGSETNRIDRQAAGWSRYNSANASLYLSFRRLERRGLIVRMAKRSGWQLTPQGLSAARQLA